MCLEGRNKKRAYWDRKRDNTISGVCVDERERERICYTESKGKVGCCREEQKEGDNVRLDER